MVKWNPKVRMFLETKCDSFITKRFVLNFKAWDDQKEKKISFQEE